MFARKTSGTVTLLLASAVVVALVAAMSWAEMRGPALAQQPDSGTLVVAKECLNAGSATAEFSLELSRGTSTPQQYVPEEIIEAFTLGCGESRTFEELEPDTYNVLETQTAGGGFGQIANFCINVEVTAGETVECNLTNERFPAVQPPATGDGGLQVSRP